MVQPLFDVANQKTTIMSMEDAVSAIKYQNVKKHFTLNTAPELSWF